MRSPFSRLVRRSVRAGGNMASQIIVSVAAAVCVGFITNAYLEQKPQPTAPAALLSEPADAAATVAATKPADTAAAARIIREASAEGATGPATLPPLPAQLIADMPVRDVATPGAEIFPGVPAESTLTEAMRNPAPAVEPKRERRRFLGIPLPYVPSASDIIGSATAAGDKLVSIVER